MKDARTKITEQSRRWARHENVSDVGTTSSFANMEALLRREYHGRFVIELVQNARDAWYANGRPAHERCTVRVLVHGDPPVLVVCNQGVPLDVDGLFKHVCQFGESSKRAGTGIGHKGIGFKSVLEVTPCPEILSRAGAGEFGLRVRFDRHLTLPLIAETSRRPWDALVNECDPEGLRDAVSRLPILRFPHWLERPAEEVELEAVDGTIEFNTVVRLPFDQRLGASKAEWLETVRAATAALGDETLILLDAFERVVFDDQIAGRTTELVIEKRRVREIASENGGVVHEVSLERNGHPTNTWLLYERSVGDGHTLASEIAVGVELVRTEGLWSPTLSRTEARCFHLFFPTRIASGLPFLLHAYFEVDAGRTRFAPDAQARNAALLDELRLLLVDAVRDLVAAEDVDSSRLPALFGACEPASNDPLALSFRDDVLCALDHVPWIHGEDGSLAAPKSLLLDENPELLKLLPVAFPGPYLAARTGACHPAFPIVSDPAARTFLAARATKPLFGDGGLLPTLLRPGTEAGPWAQAPAQPDAGFEALMRILDFATTNHRTWFETMCGGLRGDAEAGFLPVVDDSGGRRLVPPPSEERGEGVTVFARVRGDEQASSELGVPACLDVAFLPAAILTQEQVAGSGALLGIRRFGTDAVLDVVPTRAWADEESPLVARFTWRLLLRESLSRYSIKAALDVRHQIDPGRDFWCNPALVSNRDERREVYRLQALASTPVLAADGSWQPATALCFGPEWAAGPPVGNGDRLSDEARAARQTAYDDLSRLAPGPSKLVASPEALAEVLELSDEDIPWLRDEVLGAWRLPGDPSTLQDVDPDTRRKLHHELLHVLLLRLGVWEVPPVEAVVGDLRPEAVVVDPWHDRADLQGRTEWLSWLLDNRPEWFGVGYPHGKVRVAANYRLRWSPVGKSGIMARALSRGSKLYSRLLRARLLCHRCSMHKYRHWSRESGRPNSLLGYQLARSAWVPVTIDARPGASRPPGATWWLADPPDEPGRIATNPRRFLPLVVRGLEPDLLRQVGGHGLEGASPDELHTLLLQLRQQFESDALPVDLDSGSARQAFVGLHRMLYVRLARAAANDVAQRVLDEVGVLARIGSQMVFRGRTEVVHDDGSYSQYRRHFIGKVPFAPLRVGEEDVASALGMARFVVGCEMAPAPNRESHTHVIADFLDEDRLAEVMALLTHVALGGRALDVASKDFQRRSRRLRKLEVCRVPDVVLNLTVAIPGSAERISVQIGEGADQDVFLDWQPGRAKATLYHDFQGHDWFETHVQRRLGEVVARLVENPAFQDTLTLFFQETGDGRWAFLSERGVTRGGLQQVRTALDAGGVLSREKAGIWWRAVLDVCGAHVSAGLPDEAGPKVIAALRAVGWGDADRRDHLVAAGGGDEARRDTSPRSALALLENGGVDLRAFDQRLRELGDSGLSITAAGSLLRRWRAEHGFKVVWLLVSKDVALLEARARMSAWAVPYCQQFRTAPAAADVLADVVADLGAVGLNVSGEDLGGDSVDDVLAGLAGVPPLEWPAIWREVVDARERAKLLRRRALSWREALELPVVVLLTAPGDLPHQIRAERDGYQAAVPPTVATPDNVRNALVPLLESRGMENSAIVTAIPDGDTLDVPDNDVLLHLLSDHDTHHIEDVRAALKRRGRERLDALRKSMDELRKAGVAPVPYAGSRVHQRMDTNQATNKKRVRVGKVNKRNLRQIGARGEAWALAAIAQPLLALLEESPSQFAHAVEELRSLLTRHWEGAAVDKLLPHAERALDPALDRDARTEALASFLHLSEVSDGFGCDMLGWMAPYDGGEPRALALEVKSSTGRHFLVSDHEWRTAERLDDDYAFLVVMRKGRAAEGMEVLPQPEALRSAEPPQLARDPDTWKVTYSPP